MSGKTKIVVLHMKELIYTGIFAVLGILFVILLVMMFLPKDTSGNEDGTGTTTETGNLSEHITNDYLEQDTAKDHTDTASSDIALYIPGIYTTELVLGEQSIDVEVIVDKTSITSIRMINLDEAVTTMYPLLQPTFDSICEQVYELQTLEGVTYATDSKYTSLVLLEAIGHSIDKASVE